jgi:hypothetical protein
MVESATADFKVASPALKKISEQLLAPRQPATSDPPLNKCAVKWVPPAPGGNSGSSGSSSGNTLSTTTLAGAVGGTIVGALILLFVYYFYCYKKDLSSSGSSTSSRRDNEGHISQQRRYENDGGSNKQQWDDQRLQQQQQPHYSQQQYSQQQYSQQQYSQQQYSQQQYGQQQNSQKWENYPEKSQFEPYRASLELSATNSDRYSQQLNPMYNSAAYSDPSSWTRHVESDTGEPYWHNELTDEYTYDEPSCMRGSQIASSAEDLLARGKVYDDPTCWVELADETTGSPFWYNEQLDAARWEIPECLRKPEEIAAARERKLRIVAGNNLVRPASSRGSPSALAKIERLSSQRMSFEPKKGLPRAPPKRPKPQR